MKNLLIALSFAAALAPAALGDNVGSGSVSPGSFKLYEKPGTDPSPECDVHVQLQLINGFVAPVATLHTDVLGVCEVEVDRTPRVFNLTETAADCGSRRYTGGDFASGEAGVVTGIEVIDHRQRECKDRVPAPVIVNETYGDGTVVTLYSSDLRAAAPAPVSAQGVLTAVVASGGESTGTALAKDDGSLLELDLATHGFQNRFEDGRAAAVSGSLRTVTGVEVPDRTVLVVDSLTLQ